jgi:SAM-dependent methyltransferase
MTAQGNLHDEIDGMIQDVEGTYLRATDAYGQSGFHGDARRWEALRRPVVAAVDRAGSFLDIGCANGLLLESALGWAREAGYRMTPFGLDRSAALVDLARERLGGCRGAIYLGDALSFEPPQRFDYVRTELVYVSRDARRAFVERIFTRFLTRGGRLIVASYGTRSGNPSAEPVGELLRSWDLRVLGEAEGVDPWSGKTLTRVAWLGAAVRK